MRNTLLITDLDNTLYDWVSFFTVAFRGMVHELTEILEVAEERLLNEFRAVHQRYGNSEQPFAVLELPILREKFPGLSQADLVRKIDPALHRFNSLRKQTLQLYPGVSDTLQLLTDAGVKIVGHTEAMLANAYWRLRALKIDQYFVRLYTLEGKEAIHIADTNRWVDPPVGFVRVLPKAERKPNPALVVDICRHEDATPGNTYYLGDSLVRDIAMAKSAGVKSIWAKYGIEYDPSHWAYLVRITHWTDEDVRREKDLKSKYAHVSPDFTIDTFRSLGPIIIGPQESSKNLTPLGAP